MYLKLITFSAYVIFEPVLNSTGSTYSSDLQQDIQVARVKHSHVIRPLNDTVKPLEWLIGCWKTSEGIGQYPTIKNFCYTEQLEFSHVGQPNIQFSFYSFNDLGTVPMHREVGFLRIKPGTNHVAFVSAHNNGLADMEEGEVESQQLTLSTTSLGRMSFGSPPAVKQITRTFKREGDELVQVISMETSNTSLTQHLSARYQRQT